MTLSSAANGRWNPPGWFLLWAVVLSPVAANDETGSLPLHRQIDAIIEAGLVTPPAPPADDSTFLRRVYLDLAGRIPSAEEARTFLADDDPAKRRALVDELLASPAHARHLATTFDVWWMERRPEAHVKTPEWRTFLFEAFSENRPYHRLVADVLSADGTDDRNRDAARFYLDRLGEPHLITRDVGRLFFGRDLQCAQCHDHPNIPDYLQRDYHGLHAFFGRTYLFQPDKKVPAVLAEHAAGGGDFKSVFTDVEAISQPRVPLGRAVFPDPPLEPGQEYRVKPNPKDKKLQPIPTYSRREQVAAAITESDNEAFNRNIANRLWALMMGRGLVEPLDFHHASNPPTHPELLALLAETFSRMEYDTRAFLREIALTQAYQRRSEIPELDWGPEAERLAERRRVLEAEEARQRLASQAAADALDEAKDAWNAARLEAIGPESEFRAAEDKRVAAIKTLQEAAEALAAAEKSRDEAVAKTAEGQANPESAKLDAAVKAALEKKTAAETQVAAATEAAKKLEPAARAEEAKVARVAKALEEAQSAYENAKTSWKLAQRKTEDARGLVDHATTLGSSNDGLEASHPAIARQAGVLAELEERAAQLEAVAIEAQAIREEFVDDDDLVLAAAILGKRSLDAAADAEAAAKRLAEMKIAAAPPATPGDAAQRSEREEASLQDLTSRWAQAFAIGPFIHLTPEQFCASMLEATGEREKYRIAGEADFTKKLAEQASKKEGDSKDQVKDKAPEPPLVEGDRETYVADYVETRVAATTQQFVSLFGGQSGLPQGDFFATADQALFLSNAGTLRGWLRPSGNNLSARLMAMEVPEDLARELYLAILTREPGPDEITAVTDYLETRGEQRSEAVQELGWALLSSVEFRFKH